MVSPSKMADEERPGPRSPLPSVYKIFCKYQKRIEHVFVHEFDISNGIYGLKGYLGTLGAMKDRQIRLSPFLVNMIPVTPLPNPVTGFSSFFIIRLLDSTDPTYKVDLLFRDVDLYFVGFRRELVKEDEGKEDEEGTEAMIEEEGPRGKKMTQKQKERAAVKAALKENKAGWGKWHEFTEHDLKLPSFFGATSCGISASYGHSSSRTPGGWKTFAEILLTLALFDEGKVSKHAVEKACYCVMVMFSEASRLPSVLKEVLRRIVEDHPPRELEPELGRIITNWSQLGRTALEARLDGKMEGSRKLDGNFAEKFGADQGGKLVLSKLEDIIDEHNGVIMLFKANVTYLGFTRDEVTNIAKEACNRLNGPAYEIDIMF